MKRWLYGRALGPVAELDSNGTLSQFVYVSKPHVPDFVIRGTNTYRVITDQLGSVRVVQNVAAGSINDKPFQAEYTAFGEVTFASGTAPDWLPFGYAGGLYDHDTKLVRFGTRDYEPTIGRWTSKDPIRWLGGESNLYAYVGNDPINRIDPEGTFWWIVGGAAIGAGADLAWQLYQNGGDFDCVDWAEVGKYALVGAAAGTGLEFLFGTAFTGLAASGELVAVTQWGSRATPWVMLGSNNLRNWLLAGGPQLAAMGTGVTQYVLRSQLQYPSGWQAVKGTWGQRILSP